MNQFVPTFDLPNEFRDWHRVPEGATIPSKVPYLVMSYQNPLPNGDHPPRQLTYLPEGRLEEKHVKRARRNLSAHFTEEPIELPAPSGITIPQHVIVLNKVRLRQDPERVWSGAIRDMIFLDQWVTFDAGTYGPLVYAVDILEGESAVENVSPLSEFDTRPRRAGNVYLTFKPEHKVWESYNGYWYTSLAQAQSFLGKIVFDNGPFLDKEDDDLITDLDMVDFDD